ncbi:MAG: hypothetical protein WCS96_14635 [Victivallales bacterium]
MGNLEFFDSNVYLGRPQGVRIFANLPEKELLGTLNANSITQALVWHYSQLEDHPATGNEILAAAVADRKNLKGVWALMPPQTGEIICRDFFRKMKKNKIGALTAFPNKHKFLMRRTVWGSFMDEVSDRKIPLIFSMQYGIGWESLYAFLEQYPEITCILSDIGIWGVDRYTWPLLENFPNVRLESSQLSLEAGGLEETTRKYGASRIVFGSGFPERYAEAATLQLSHADISDREKRMIAKENLESILAGIKYE